jgi:hypothetical protein
MTTCDRCGKQTSLTIMSMFNTDTLCESCKDSEERHPSYGHAVDAELAAVQSGDLNYAGIGRPADL